MDDWEFLDKLPPRSEYASSFEYAREVSEIVIENYPGEVTADMQWSALYFGNICFMIVEDGYNVITREEIQDALHYSQTSPESGVLHISEIETWLFRAGFRKIDTKYCGSDKYTQYDHIYCAPIIPSSDELIMDLGNPPAVSLEMIEGLLRRYSIKEDCPRDRAHIGQQRKVDEQELDAYLGMVRSELAEAGWYFWGSIQKRNEVWLSPAGIGERLVSLSETMSDLEVEKQIVRAILTHVPELQSHLEIDVENVLESLKRILRDRHGWNKLWYESGGEQTVTWYSPNSSFERDLKEAEEEFRAQIEEVEEWEDHEMEFLETRKRFLQENRRGLMSVVGYGKDELENKIMDLTGKIEYKKQIASLDEATPTSPADELQFGIERASSPEEQKKRSFWDLQQKLKRSEEKSRGS